MTTQSLSFMYRQSIIVAVGIAALLVTASDCSAQLARRNDALALDREMRCAGPKYKDSASPLPGPDGPRPVVAALAADLMFPIAAGTQRNDASLASLLHLTSVIAPLEACEYGWEIRADALWAEQGDLAGIVEVRLPALAFGEMGGGRYLGSAALLGNVAQTRSAGYRPSLGLDRDVAAGFALRVHLPAALQVPKLGEAQTKFNPSVSLFGRWSWDDSVQARRGQDFVPHLAVMVPIPVLRFGIIGAAYGYERIWSFSGSEPLTRHWAGVGTAASAGAPIRTTFRWSIERIGGAILLRQVTIAFHTPSKLIGHTGGPH